MSNYLEQHTSKKLCSSGDWLLSSREFQSWCPSNSGLLWITGPPGSGKTVLSTSIIEHLQSSARPTAAVAYFFFDFQDSDAQSLLHVARTLISQLLSTWPDLPQNLREVFEHAQNLGRAKISQSEALDGLMEILRSTEFRVSIILDGLDESTESTQISNFLLRLLGIAKSNVNVVVLSRDVPEIRTVLQKHEQMLIVSMANNETDIHAYLSKAIPCTALELDAPMEQDIIKRLLEGAERSFLWASLMVGHLESATSTYDMNQILIGPLPNMEKMLAKSLHQLAEKKPAERELARRLIYWICSSQKPLTLVELQGAMAICSARGTFDPARKPFDFVIRRLCSSLFEIEPRTQTVRPIHASIKDFLVGASAMPQILSSKNNFLIDERQSHQNIANECLILLREALQPRGIHDQPFFEPLTRYACLYWLEHLLESKRTSRVMDKAAIFLESSCRPRWIYLFLLWQRRSFPLQRLFSLRGQLLALLDLQHYSKAPPHLDWAFDVALALLKLYQTRCCSTEFAEYYSSSRRASTEGFSHFEIMMVVRDLSRHFTQSRRIHNAISLFDRALAEEQGFCDPNADFMTTVLLMNTLGILLDQAGEVDRAIEMQRTALSISSAHESNVSCTHLARWTRNELGRMHRHQKSYAAAEKVHLDALQTLEQLAAHPHSVDLEIAWTRSTLARVYRCQRRYDAAIAHSAAALHTRTRILGPEHPHALWLQSDIAQCYFEQGKYSAAAAQHREVYARRGKVLGAGHPDTLWTMNNLGVALAMTGEAGTAESRALQRRAYECQGRVLGLDHPHTIWTRTLLSAQEAGKGIGLEVF